MHYPNALFQDSKSNRKASFVLKGFLDHWDIYEIIYLFPYDKKGLPHFGTNKCPDRLKIK